MKGRMRRIRKPEHDGQSALWANINPMVNWLNKRRPSEEVPTTWRTLKLHMRSGWSSLIGDER